MMFPTSAFRILFTTALFLLPFSGRTAADSVTIKVSTPEEFLKAVGSNRTIVMAPGTYQFSKPLNLSGLLNLHITGESKNKTGVRIRQNDDATQVMTFRDCSGLSLESLDFFHSTETEHGSALLLGLFNCNEISIRSCGFSDTRNVGLFIKQCKQVSLRECVFYDCYQHLLKIEGTKNVTVQSCSFISSQLEGAAIQLANAYQTIFTSCEWSEIEVSTAASAGLVEGFDIQDCTFTKCRFTENSAKALTSGLAAELFVFEKCKFKNNRF